MSKKILILCGSPRKNGNTNTIVKWVEEGAAGAGAEVECIDTVRLNYKSHGCTACMSCQQSDKFECVIDDDATPILKRMTEYDIIAFATPVYFFGPTAQLKVFTDRMHSLFKFNPETGEFTHNFTGKTLALIATSGGEYDNNLQLLEQVDEGFAKFVGMNYMSLLEPLAPHDTQELLMNKELKEKSIKFGKSLARS